MSWLWGGEEPKRGGLWGEEGGNKGEGGFFAVLGAVFGAPLGGEEPNKGEESVGEGEEGKSGLAAGFGMVSGWVWVGHDHDRRHQSP